MARPSSVAFAVVATLAICSSAGGSASVLRGAAAPSTAVPDTSAPDVPTGLQVLARQDSTVTLAWKAALTGPRASGYVIEGGILPGEVLGSIPTGSTATVFTFDAPPGRFLVRVHAVGSGGRSAASNEIALVVGDLAATGRAVRARALAGSRRRRLARTVVDVDACGRRPSAPVAVGVRRARRRAAAAGRRVVHGGRRAARNLHVRACARPTPPDRVRRRIP